MGQILRRENAAEFVHNLQKSGKTIAVTNGCFDILHVGHVRYLQKTKSFADYTIVLLNSDKSVSAIKGNGRPVNCENDRAEILCALSCVDYVILFDEASPRDLLEDIKPDVYTKGADYTAETLPEADIMLKYNIRVEFIEFTPEKSTTELIKSMRNKS